MRFARLEEIFELNGDFPCEGFKVLKDTVTLGAAVLKSLTNGSIGVGFEGMTNGANTKDGEGFEWAIPIRFQVGF